MTDMKGSITLLCPRCRRVLGQATHLPSACPGCGLEFPRLRGCPVLREVPAGEQLDLSASPGLPSQNSAHLPIPFVRQALGSDGLVLELGAGVDSCTHPGLVKTDAYLYSPQLDYVVDAHRLPFQDDTFDFVYSLAVFEHLHSPWIAAGEIWRVLKPGGQVYTLCAFFQHVHGYPDHYFNITESGLRRLFAQFEIVDCGPSPFSPLEQIGVSLMDLKEMVQALRAQRRAFANATANVRDVAALESHLHEVIQLVVKLQRDLIQPPAARAAWRRIAPGFELIARKPLADQLAHPTFDRAAYD